MQVGRKVIVTGANKGIGQAIAQNLAGKGWNVILAVRNLALGEVAVKKIQQKYPNATLHLEQLDISDFGSIATFVSLVQEKYKTVDVLINNAAVAIKEKLEQSQKVKLTLAPNFYGTIELTEKILPLISDNGKIITLGSTYGKMTYGMLTNEQLKLRLRNENLTKEQLLQIVHQYENLVKENVHSQRGWPSDSYASYGVSKLFINLYVSIFGKSIEAKSRGIQVYVCCPGYVKTDLNNNSGPLTVEQGIQTPIYLVQLPFQLKEEWQGGFFYQQKKISLFE